jgi:hypothetical protein
VNISLFVFLYSLATKIPENIVAILEFKTAKLLNTNIKVIRKTVSFLKKEGDINFEGGIMKDLGINDKNKQLKNILCFTVEIFFMFFFLSELKWTITIQHLQEPIFFLTNEIFGGWMTIFKIYAATTGIIFSTFKREPICRLEWGQAFQQAFI